MIYLLPGVCRQKMKIIDKNSKEKPLMNIMEKHYDKKYKQST